MKIGSSRSGIDNLDSYLAKKNYDKALDTIRKELAKHPNQLNLRLRQAEILDLQGQRDKAAMRRGFRFVFQNPLLTMKRDVVKFFNFWQLERIFIAGAARGYWGVAAKWLRCFSQFAVIYSHMTGDTAI